MATILAISGSLRAGSYNTLLLRALVAAAPAGTALGGLMQERPLLADDWRAVLERTGAGRAAQRSAAVITRRAPTNRIDQ